MPYDVVSRALTAQGWTVSSAKLGRGARNPVSLDEAARAEMVAFLEGIGEDDDVQGVYAGLA